MRRREFIPAAAAGLLAACAKTSKLRLALNWKPDPQFGGFYAAPFEKHGLDVDILPGGAGTPTVQMIGAGSAEFGIVSADELVLARSLGNDVVAIFAVFQNCPQGLMAQGTVGLQRGLAYARLLEKRYGFGKVKIVPSPGGDISAFLSDEKFAQQCFLMSEPLQARHKGVAVQTFPISDVGYNPYTTVVAVSGALLKSDGARVKEFRAAVAEGWREYLNRPEATNQRMGQLNPSMDAATFAEVAEAQKSFIETDETRKLGLGVLTQARWEALIATLQELGDLKTTVRAEDCFHAL
jgi:NitT/TauT family transport system substrate-binding protein